MYLPNERKQDDRGTQHFQRLHQRTCKWTRADNTVSYASAGRLFPLRTICANQLQQDYNITHLVTLIPRTVPPEKPGVKGIVSDTVHDVIQ